MKDFFYWGSVWVRVLQLHPFLQNIKDVKINKDFPEQTRSVSFIYHSYSSLCLSLLTSFHFFFSLLFIYLPFSSFFSFSSLIHFSFVLFLLLISLSFLPDFFLILTQSSEPFSVFLVLLFIFFQFILLNGLFYLFSSPGSCPPRFRTFLYLRLCSDSQFGVFTSLLFHH